MEMISENNKKINEKEQECIPPLSDKFTQRGKISGKNEIMSKKFNKEANTKKEKKPNQKEIRLSQQEYRKNIK